ncbi:MAG: hypothetical protein AB1629_08440 [Candidatus Omnitrophota bacterium]
MKLFLPLTEKQKQLFEDIISFWDKNGYPPTYNEMKTVTQTKNIFAIQKHIKSLETKGYISIVKGKRRGIRLTETGEEYASKLHQLGLFEYGKRG